MSNKIFSICTIPGDGIGPDIIESAIKIVDKASNIVEISKDLNIGIDSFVFIDDNPIERELVKSLLPEVCVPDFPEQAYMLPDFFKKVYPILYELLIERGGLVLIDQRNAILWDNSVDITDDAIAAINRVLGSGVKTN